MRITLEQPTRLPADWLKPDGLLRLMPAAEIDRVSLSARRQWCHHHARYGLVTAELIDWLRDYIAGRPALEIGAGAGDLAHHLGIRATDSKCQNEPAIRAYYQMMQQPCIAYPDWVEQIEALDAVQRYRPAVVVASWVTHWIDPDKPIPIGGGSVVGVREDQLLAAGVTYILIGNLQVHAFKPILGLPHQQFQLPWLRSRAARPEADRIFIWNGLTA